MQALAKAGGQLKDSVVGHQDHDVPCRVQHGRADLAGLQMAVDLGAQDRVHLAVDIRGDVFPHVFAIDPHAPHPNSPLRLGASPFNRGARSRCRSARARCNRTLTAPSLISSATAVSLMSISSMSLSSTTFR